MIPLRPKDDSRFGNIKKLDKDCLVHNVLFGCRQEESYIRYYPEYAGVEGKIGANGKRAARQFFSYARHREFMDSYRATLEEFGNRKSSGFSEPDGVDVGDIQDMDRARKDKALRSLLDKTMSLVEDGTAELDPDTLKVVTDIFNKLGLIKGEEEKQEAPRRYLPVRCLNECQYRFFVEEQLAAGNAENECLRCRALALAREHGFVYDPTRLLNPSPDK